MRMKFASRMCCNSPRSHIRQGLVEVPLFLRCPELPEPARDERLQVVRVDPDRVRDPQVPDLPALA